jgi:Na+:H+ antiporter
MGQITTSLLALTALSRDPHLSLAVSMLLVFGSAKLLAEVFERLHQPGIVGEILAGVLIGPSVLGWIAPNENLAFLAELGVMFLLFRVGLEVKPAALIEVGRTATAVGILGVALPFVVGWATLRLWGAPQIESLFVGAALTATSVGITAHLLSSKGLLNRTAGKIILAAAVIDDILALLVLGVISSVASGSVNILELVLTTVFALAFVFLVLRWGSDTADRMLPKLQRRMRIAESQFAIAMILLFALAALSERTGVAPIIGAFLAGLAMGRALPRRVHELTQGVTELLVPFFLAGIGLHFDWQAFAHRSTLALSLIVLVIAIAAKIVGCGAGALTQGAPVAFRVGVGMVPRGEFCMVVAQIGLGLKAISAETYDIVVFMAVAATLLTAPLVNFAFRGVGRAELQDRAESS